MEESTKLVDESTEALWYVVHTYSGYENKVANDLQTMVENRHLQELICDIKVPVEMVPEIDKNGKQKMVEHKLFPGYVLVKMVMNDDTWYVVRNTRGCTGFVGPASKPVPLSAEEVEKMGVEKAAPPMKIRRRSFLSGRHRRNVTDMHSMSLDLSTNGKMNPRKISSGRHSATRRRSRWEMRVLHGGFPILRRDCLGAGRSRIKGEFFLRCAIKYDRIFN